MIKLLYVIFEAFMAFSVGAWGGLTAFWACKRRINIQANRLTLGLIRGYDVRYKTTQVIISHIACETTIFGNCVDEIDYIIDAHEKRCPVLAK